jgi:endo-alpha-1,4-polygalactosaminidase (GH114 family)
MADDRSIRDAADRSRINMQEDYEVRYWTQTWNAIVSMLPAKALMS